MSDTEISRHVARQLPPGEHRLTNGDLRDLYGIARVTVSARAMIAHELAAAGMQVLSDPSRQPLVVRKPAPDLDATVAAVAAVAAGEATRPRWRRRWIIALAGMLALVIVVAASSGDGETPNTADDAAAKGSPGPRPERAVTPIRTLSDAEQAVGSDHYRDALVIAAMLGREGERRIERKIADRVARRAQAAIRAGDTGRASRLLLSAEDYPTVPATRRAKASLRAAQRRARARAAQKAEERAQRRAAAPAAASGPSSRSCDPNYSGCLNPNSPDYDCAGGSGNGPDYTGTVRVTGMDRFDLDRDGDGVACDT